MVFALRDLFQAAFELKKKENDMKGESTEKPAAAADSAAASAPAATSPTTAVAPAASTPAPAAAAAAQPSLVLLCIHKRVQIILIM